MAAETFPVKPRAGMPAEEWLKVWEKGFRHDHSHIPDNDDDPERADKHNHHHSHSHHHHHSHQQHGHQTESDVDEKGNQLRVDKYLKNNLEHLTDGKTDKSILVSLCGNSPDMEWLSSKGYSVVGVELSEIGVKSAFEKNELNSSKPIPYEVTVDGSLKVYSATDGKKMKIYVANFFDDALTPGKLGTFDCIWDSHGIISVPVPQQEPYAQKLITFLKPGGKMMFSTVAFDDTKLKSDHGPSPVSMSVLQKFYPEQKVQILESTPIEPCVLDGAEGWTNQVVLIC